MKRKFTLLLVLVMAVMSFAACADNGGSKEVMNVYEGTPLADKGPIKIAVIRNLGADEHTAQFLAGAVEEGKSLGFEVNTFTTDGDNAKFEDIFNQVLIGDYDGIVVSHGQDNAQGLIEQAIKENIPVVTFDTNAKVSGVTSTAQDDFSLARLSLEELVKANEGKTPRIIKMWIAGFPPMERREEVYKEYVEAGKIEEIAVVGEVGDFSNIAGLNADAIGSLLTRYPKGEIDAIWASWDAFATGAFTALNENDRNEIKIFGVDVSNADLQMIQQENSSWVMTAAADAKLVGTLNVRLLAKKIAGEETPDAFEIPATTIKQDDLMKAGGQVTVQTLADVYDTWGKSELFNEEWMKKLRSNK
ncbi:MAG: sugar ABC transporter substrate-binding protein [Anaeromicrobium sp.]|jgi:simple sugar transport system substrate-binding protein|uniref:sugar ABC transporter substrate-binding protein n=1 Tax=Anaeromicrobium sp. TaxID=1929132 RepID=UPI0025F52157|nr:sugar ABC transporter substrate-binding protein [Anaeromicrobium sp.]MCT4595301.1 sugar ABC transporter substrate-binding protein [Anaeromicrobium sp.]